jgi:methyl-accepting chemotaxis protein
MPQELATGTGQSATSMAIAAQEAAGVMRVVAGVQKQFVASDAATGHALEEAAHALTSSRTLAERMRDITSIAELIRGIPARTNLPALNAATEAVMAGDSGRGFAVIASEVKSLAQQTASATDEIALYVVLVTAATDRAVTQPGAIVAAVDDARRMPSAERWGEQAVTVSAIAESVDEKRHSPPAR